LSCDIDIFFKNAQQCERWYRTLLTIPYGNRIVSEAKTNRFNTSLKYHVHNGNYDKTIVLQLISFKFFDSLTSVVDSFDFTACQFGFDGEKLYVGDTSFEDLKNREIIFHNVTDKVATGFHLKKYETIGFKIPESQKQKYDEIVMASPEQTKSEYNSIFDDESVSEEDEPYPIPENSTVLDLSSITTNNNTVGITNTVIPAPIYGHMPLMNATLFDASNSYINTNPCSEITLDSSVTNAYTRMYNNYMNATNSTVGVPMDYSMDYVYLEGNRTTSPETI